MEPRSLHLQQAFENQMVQAAVEIVHQKLTQNQYRLIPSKCGLCFLTIILSSVCSSFSKVLSFSLLYEKWLAGYFPLNVLRF